MEAHSQIRYNSKKVQSTISLCNDRIKVDFLDPQLAVTPGQSIVFYIEDILIGGGIIEIL